VASDRASLVLHSESGIPLFYVREFLTAIEAAYNYCYLAERFITYPPEARSSIVAQAMEGGRRFGRWVPMSDRLLLGAVMLESPGFWELVGKLNPLEQIRLYLNERHERRKDREYREAAERDRLLLDNEMRATEVLAAKVRAAKEMGATDNDLAPLLDVFVRAPLSRLDRFQDEGLIQDAEIHDRSPNTPEKQRRPVRKFRLEQHED